jgi:hypothetical protein
MSDETKGIAKSSEVSKDGRTITVRGKCEKVILPRMDSIKAGDTFIIINETDGPIKICPNENSSVVLNTEGGAESI